MSRRLDAKVALIAGGASRIGAAIARLFAREGAKVVIADVDVGSGVDYSQRGNSLGDSVRDAPRPCCVMASTLMNELDSKNRFHPCSWRSLALERGSKIGISGRRFRTSPQVA